MRSVRLLPGRLAVAFGLAVVSLAPATSALAQSLQPQSQRSPLQQSMDANLRDMQLRAQQDMVARQSVLQQNQLTVLEAQIRTQQAIEDVQAQTRAPQLAPSGAGLPNLDTSKLASIPDDRLAASNARVRAAAGNH